jgi:hypothetical protein
VGLPVLTRVWKSYALLHFRTARNKHGALVGAVVVVMLRMQDATRGREAGPPALRAVAHAVALQRNSPCFRISSPAVRRRAT